MRVLFYAEKIKGNPVSLGIHIFEVLSGLSKLGHVILYANGQGISIFEDIEINSAPGRSRHRSLWNRIKVFVLASPFRDGILLLYGLLKGLKLFFTAFRTVLQYNPDLIYGRHELFSSEYIIAKLFRLPCVKEVNGIIIDEVKITKTWGRLSMAIIDKIERLNMPKADRYIVVTPQLKKVLCRDYKIPEGKIVLIENGANTALFKPVDISQAKKHLGLSLSDSYICFVGSLYPWQGVEFLITAMPYILKECPNTRVLVVGDGEMKDKLIELSKQLGVSDKVLFAGKVAYEQVPWYINASDICVAPFVKERNQRIGLSPLKLCEYLACGKPVVASRISGLEILEEYECGFLVDPENSEALATRIMELLRNPELRQQMGENGQKYVVENRSWENVAKKVAAVCEVAVQEHKRQRT